MKKYKTASNINISYVDFTNSSMSSGFISSSVKEDSFFNIIKDSTLIYTTITPSNEEILEPTEIEKRANQRLNCDREKTAV